MERKGKDTKRTLLKAAEGLFARMGFNRASVSAICREAGVAQGTFYRYFQNKEDIYVALVAILEESLKRRISRAVAAAPSGGKLLSGFEALLSGIERNARLYQIFREAEFVRMEIPRRFYTSIARLLAEALREDMDYSGRDPEVVTLATIGIAEFIAMRYLLWKREGLSRETLSTAREMISRGIDPDEWNCAPREMELPGDERGDESPNGGAATRRALLEAAERLFGQAGFYGTTVFEITYVAGVAPGTFYLYFPSKTDIFVTLVREINRKLRWAVRRAISGASDRREVECLGFQAFFEFIGRHPEAYRIVREAEFVNDEIGRWYYRRLAEPYARELAQAMERGEIRKMSPEPLAYALLGIGHLIGLRWIVWEGMKRLPPEVLKATLDFILHGVGKKA